MTKDERRAFTDLREEIALLRERVAVLEAGYYPVSPWFIPYWPTTWGEYTTGSDYDMSGGCLTTGGSESVT